MKRDCLIVASLFLVLGLFFGQLIPHLQSDAAILTKCNLVAIMDQPLDGYHATLKLKSLQVVNSGGDAVTFQSTGNNGAGLFVYGHGTGPGLHAVSGQTTGASGIRAKCYELSTSCDGISSQGYGDGAGLALLGGDNFGVGLDAKAGQFGGDGYGIQAVGGGTGDGLVGVGANAAGIRGYASNGPGMKAESFGGNNAGFYIAGNGSGPGMNISGGASGDGLKTTGPGAGVGISIDGGTLTAH